MQTIENATLGRETVIHVYSQERDLVVSFFINQLISYLLTFSRGGGGCRAPSISFVSTDLFIFCLYHKLQLLAI